MVIDRKIVSYILKTSPENIKTMFEEGNQIKVVLYDSQETATITIERYRTVKRKIEKHLSKRKKEAKKAKKKLELEDNLPVIKLDSLTQKNWGVLLSVLGSLAMLGGLGMDTTVRSDYGRVHNIGKQQEQTLITTIGGFSVLGGILLFTLDKDEKSEESKKSEQNINNFLLSLIIVVPIAFLAIEEGIVQPNRRNNELNKSLEETDEILKNLNYAYSDYSRQLQGVEAIQGLSSEERDRKIESYTSYIEENKDDAPMTYYLRGVLHLQEGNQRQGIKDLEKAATLFKEQENEELHKEVLEELQKHK